MLERFISHRYKKPARRRLAKILTNRMRAVNLPDDGRAEPSREADESGA